MLVVARDSAGAPLVKVVFNDKKGTLDYAAAVSVPVPKNARAAVPIRATDDGKRSVAVLSDDGTVAIYSLDASRAFVPPAAPVLKVPVGSFVGLIAADVDGDVVDDLVVDSAASITIYRGVGKRP